MSSLSYNGVRIDLMTTDSIVHEPVRADDGSYLWTKVVIEVSGLIYGTPPQSQNPTGAAINRTLLLGTAPTTIIAGIRAALMQERAPLIYDLEDGSGKPLISSPATDGNGNYLPCDCCNGPIPEVMALANVGGIKSLSVRFRVTTWTKECAGYTGPNGPDALVANRSYQTHTINPQHLTTITTVGQATFRTDVLEAAQQQADHYRYLLFGPVPKGCQRVSVDIQATPARNVLTYRYIDQERFFDIGETGPTGSNSGIQDVKFIYGTSTTGQNGGPISPVTAHNVSITIVGDKSASHWRMTLAAFALAQTKLPIFDPTQGYLTQMSVRQVMHDRVVEFNAAMMLHAHNGGGPIPALNVDGLRIDAVFPDRGGINPAMPSRSGTAGTYQNELLVTAWKGACAPPTKAYEGKYTNESKVPSYSPDTGPIVTVSVDNSTQAPTLKPRYSTSQSLKPYVSYKLDFQQDYDSGKLMVPNAGNPANNSSSSSESQDNTSPFCSILTLGYPTETIRIQFEAERIGASAAIPAFASSDKNRVLMKSRLHVAEPQLMTDGVTKVFSIKGWAEYACLKLYDSRAPMPYPASPMQQGTYGSDPVAFVNPGDYISGLLDPIGGVNDPTSPPTSPTSPGSSGTASSQAAFVPS